MGVARDEVSRRDFVKKVGVGTAAAVGAAAVPGVTSASADKVKQYGMVIDTRKCIGCQGCSVACKSEFGVPLGHTRSWVEYVEKGTFPDVTRSFLPRLCNHCSDPQCVAVCPTGATYRREQDGVVDIDSEVCIGCKYCMQACPYGVRFINPVSGSADKCDFCLHRVKEGLVPSCVNTCMGRARIFGDLNDPNSEVSRVIAKNPVTVLRKEMGTKPNVFYIAADHLNKKDMPYPDQYVRITTHRRQKERV
jgi:tetrathionate reductase subunit B